MCSNDLSLARFVATLIAFCLTTLASITSYGAAASQKPNFILILADDLGWTDLACYGSKLYETPNLDQLARDGVKFTQNYSACTVCSPTRAALLTGKYPARLHITDWIPGQMPDNPKLIVPDWTKYLPLDETTMANVFHKAGYATAALGKWHLGGEEYYPNKHGFDFFLAGTDKPNTEHYFSPYGIPTLPDGPEGEYVVVLENTPEVHNLVVCTLCSCYPWPILGLPPKWYKAPAYRSRAVREPRKLLAEMGTAIPDDVEIRVWDSSAEARYLVLPMRPEGTEDLSEQELAGVVTRDSMIGVQRL